METKIGFIKKITEAISLYFKIERKYKEMYNLDLKGKSDFADSLMLETRLLEHDFHKLTNFLFKKEISYKDIYRELNFLSYEYLKKHNTAQFNNIVVPVLLFVLLKDSEHLVLDGTCPMKGVLSETFKVTLDPTLEENTFIAFFHDERNDNKFEEEKYTLNY